MIRKPCLMADRRNESKRMRELVSRCPRGPRSSADLGREVRTGEGGAGGDEVGGCALEVDPAAAVADAGAGAEVDHRVGVRYDRLVVLDDGDPVTSNGDLNRQQSNLSHLF